MIDFLVI